MGRTEQSRAVDNDFMEREREGGFLIRIQPKRYHNISEERSPSAEPKNFPFRCIHGTRVGAPSVGQLTIDSEHFRNISCSKAMEKDGDEKAYKL